MANSKINQSRLKLAERLWGLGREDLTELLNDDDLYNPYGAPALIACCERLGIGVPGHVVAFARVPA